MTLSTILTKWSKTPTRARKLAERAFKSGVRLWAVAVWLAVWQLVAMAVGQEILLVSPVSVLKRWLALLPTVDFWARVIRSSNHILLGILIGMGAGTLLGALAARFRFVSQLFAPLVSVVRAIPVASFIIVALIWISSKNLSVFIALLICFPVFYVNVKDGICAADPKLLEMARVFRLSEYRRIRTILAPSVYPYFRSAASVAIGLAWKSGVAAELIAQSSGSIGEKLYYAKTYLMTADLFAWTLTIVLLSALFELAFNVCMGAIGIRLNGGWRLSTLKSGK